MITSYKVFDFLTTMNTTFRLTKNSMIATAQSSAMVGIASTITVATTSVSEWEVVATISIRPGNGRTQKA
ncbi:MAG: hypothetical protein ACK51V_01665 [bacterium]|jgi:hypothetical protein|nr:hypothetical protein [Betaproteobacteria bacterium]